MNNTFCKYNNNVIITNDKQPLSCLQTPNKCFVSNYNKVINFPSLYTDINSNTILEQTELACEFSSNGRVSANIDNTKYKFATYDFAKAPNQLSENSFYSMYQPAIVNGSLNYQTLTNIHSNAKNLFIEVPNTSNPSVPTFNPNTYQYNPYDINYNLSNSSNAIPTNTTNTDTITSTKQIIQDVISNKDNNTFFNMMFILIGILLIVLFLAVLSLIFYRG